MTSKLLAIVGLSLVACEGLITTGGMPEPGNHDVDAAGEPTPGSAEDASMASDCDSAPQPAADAGVASICDPVTQPAPDWGDRDGMCLRSCSALGGITCSDAPTCPVGTEATADMAYDCATCCEAGSGLTGVPVPPATSAILDDIPGYAQGTVGGRNGTIYVVTTLDGSGPGSLSEALESDAPLWIVFQEGLQGEILIDHRVYVKSFKTVDGRGRDITIEYPPGEQFDWDPQTGIALSDHGQAAVEHIVFLNLTFDGGWPDPDEDGEGADGIHIHNGTHHVWIHQCSFSNMVDGAIDARIDEGSTTLNHHISITNCYFHDINQGLLLEAERLTFARNYCDNVNTRCIKIIGGGSGHSVNNVIKDWGYREIVASRNGSQLLVDHCVFDPGNDPEVGKAGDAGSSEIDGNWVEVHSYKYLGQNVTWRDRTSVSATFKAEAQGAYGLDRRVDCEHDPPDQACWHALYDEVVAQAGAGIDN